MPAHAALCFLSHFSIPWDPRQATKLLYPRPEILLLMLCGTIAGADDFVEIGLQGSEWQASLRRFLPFEHGRGRLLNPPRRKLPAGAAVGQQRQHQLRVIIAACCRIDQEPGMGLADPELQRPR